MEEKEGAPFWADQMAEEVLARRKFHYLDKAVKYDSYTVKTSASLSGVLHIGRLTDTVRGEAVYRALKERGAKAKFIWVGEDMDPLRKLPVGMPASYEQYIGMPVTDVPDPDGCHSSYAEHHREAYLDVMKRFVGTMPEIYSMREEYRKGSFDKYIRLLLEKSGEVRAIVDKCKIGDRLEEEWMPWRPICEKCGKIITPVFKGVENGKVHYKCQDYEFKSFTAKGCGHEGLNDPSKGGGKLAWKSEWAAQWALWSVVSEGAGKEYNVPTSAWFVNAEICEKVLNFPMPLPIFYEYIMIGGGGKMSASVGNVVYPADWLKVADPEVLRYFFLKKITKAREFNWKDVPLLCRDYESAGRLYFGEATAGSASDKRMYEMAQLGKPQKSLGIDYALASSIVQIAKGREIEVLQRTGHLEQKLSAAKRAKAERLLGLARRWVDDYAPDEMRTAVLAEMPSAPIDGKIRKVLATTADALETAKDAWQLEDIMRKAAASAGVEAPKAFEAAYMLLLGKPRGPKLAPFLLSLDKGFVRKRLRMEG